MKKWKAILFGTLLTLSLCTFTACGTEVNNADETVDEKNNDERNKKKNTNENTATENGIMEDETDNDGVMDKPDHPDLSGFLLRSVLLFRYVYQCMV